MNEEEKAAFRITKKVKELYCIVVSKTLYNCYYYLKGRNFRGIQFRGFWPYPRNSILRNFFLFFSKNREPKLAKKRVKMDGQKFCLKIAHPRNFFP